MAQDRQETEQFLFNKENTPETGWDEEEEGRAFPSLCSGKGGTLMLTGLPLISAGPFNRDERKRQTRESKALCQFYCPHISVSITIIPRKSRLAPFQQCIYL